MARRFVGRLRGFLHAHLTWMIEHDYPNVAHYVPDLMAEPHAGRRQPPLLQLGRCSACCMPAAIGGLVSGSLWGALTGFLWGGVVRMFVVEQTMSAINSVMHTFGRRPSSTRDDNSRNLGIMALLAGARAGTTITTPSRIRRRSGCAGSSSIPASCSFALLEALGLAWDVKVPSAGEDRAPAHACGSRRDAGSDLETRLARSRRRATTGIAKHDAVQRLSVPAGVPAGRDPDLSRSPIRYPHARIGVLVLLSLAFYAYGNPPFILLLIASIAINWLAALAYGRMKCASIITLAIVLNLVVLGVVQIHQLHCRPISAWSFGPAAAAVRYRAAARHLLLHLPPHHVSGRSAARQGAALCARPLRALHRLLPAGDRRVRWRAGRR